MKTKHISHTINPDGQIVQANGFKQAEPTVSIHNPSPLWMHTIERTDAANPVQGFIILGITLAVMGLIIKYLV